MTPTFLKTTWADFNWSPFIHFGRRAAENPTTVWDFYATVLHILGFDHKRLTWYHNGLDRRLTDVHGHVVKEVLA